MKTVKIKHYKVLIEKGSDGYYVGTVPAIPGCLSQGETHEELIKNIQEAIELCLEVAKDNKHYRDSLKLFDEVDPRFIGIEEVAVKIRS